MASIISAGTTSGTALNMTADTSGSLQLATNNGTTALTISTAQNATFAGTVTLPTGTIYPIVSSTALASTSGTSIDFTGIPSWVKRITVMFSGVSTNGTSIIQLQLGNSGGIETTGYLGSSLSGASGTLWSTGILTAFANAAVNVASGSATITNITGNTWCIAGLFYLSNGAGGSQTAGAKALSATLDRVRITTVNGTDTFDAGSVNILYE